MQNICFLILGLCKTWHCCTNDLMPTNGNPPVTMTKKCLIIHICFRWRTTHQPYASKTLNAFSPTSEPSLKIDPWYIAAVCFSKLLKLHENYENLDTDKDSLQLFCTILFVTISSVLLCWSNIELILATGPLIIFTVRHIFIRESKMLKIFK